MIACSLLEIEDEILDNFQHAVPIVVVECVHCKIVWASQLKMNALGEELALAGSRQLPHMARVFCCWFVAHAGLASVAWWHFLLPLSFVFLFVLFVLIVFIVLIFIIIVIPVVDTNGKRSPA